MYSQAYVSHHTILASIARFRLEYLKRIAWEDCGTYLKITLFSDRWKGERPGAALTVFLVHCKGNQSSQVRKFS